MSLVVVTDQVVSRFLLGCIESSQRHTEIGRAQHSVQGAGQLLAIECPEQRACMDAEVRVDPAAGGQVGPHAKDGVLRVDDCYIWRKERENKY